MKLRKLLSTLLAAALVCGLACTAALADEPADTAAPAIPAEGTAIASTQNITIDGKAVEFAAYALKDENGNLTNYVKLRDLGEVLGFAVGYSNETGISITTTAPAAE